MRHLTSMPRRLFLQSAGACMGASLCQPHLAFPFQAQDLLKKFEELRPNLLQLINDERAVEKVPPLALDELASRVATQHASDMATGHFASHWGRDGLKPYQRYSFAGGVHATQENVSAADNTWSMKPEDLAQDTAYLHVRLYNETPPNDGHRKSILAAQHTHVGVGFAVDELRLRMVELFVAKYVEVKPLRQTAKPRESVVFAGKLKSGYLLNNIEVFYEPLPKTPELSWLREPRPYSLPEDSVVLVPKVPPPFTYADGTTGVVDVAPNGAFNVLVNLFRDAPGIYTVVCWVKRSRSSKAFAATQVCIRADV